MSTLEVTPTPTVRYYFRPWMTQALVAVNVFVYLAMALTSRSPMDFGSALTLRWGADFGPLTFGGEAWRIWTSNYVHGGIVHIAGNMWCLWNLGMLAERILGRPTYLATYTACGIAGSLTSLGWDPLRISVGASGAILGLAGALMAAIHFGKLPYPPDALHAIKQSLLRFAGLTLLLGFIPVVDNSAHTGGLIMGLVLGGLLAPHLADSSGRRVNFERMLFLGVALALLGGWIFVKHSRSYVIPLGRATQALRRGKDQQALPDLEAAAHQQPREVLIQSLLGETYIRLKNYPQAEATLKHVLELKPSDKNAEFNLGLVYGTTGRYEEARRIFADLSQRDPQNADAWLMLGSALRRLHQPAEAETALRHAIQLHPQNYAALREQGWVQLEQQQPDAALQSFQQALQINGSDAEATLGLGRAYLDKHMSKEAADALERYRALRPAPSDDPADDQLVVTP